MIMIFFEKAYEGRDIVFKSPMVYAISFAKVTGLL